MRFTHLYYQFLQRLLNFDNFDSRINWVKNYYQRKQILESLHFLISFFQFGNFHQQKTLQSDSCHTYSCLHLLFRHFSVLRREKYGQTLDSAGYRFLKKLSLADEKFPSRYQVHNSIIVCRYKCTATESPEKGPWGFWLFLKAWVRVGRKSRGTPIFVF